MVLYKLKHLDGYGEIDISLHSAANTWGDRRVRTAWGVEMWNVLKRNDLAQARHALELRRTELLRRHAEEIEQLEADRQEIDTLRRLAAAFSGKFKTQKAAPSANSAGPPAARPLPPREPWRVTPRDHPRTNFAMFSGAIARATF